MWNLEGNVRHSGLFILFPCKLGTSTGLLIATEIKPTIMDKSPNGTVMQYSYCSVISGFPHKTVHRFRNFLAVLPPPYTKLKLRQNCGCSRPTLFVGWGEGLDLCEVENAPEMQKCLKTFANDCSRDCTLKVRTSTACWTKPSLMRALAIHFERQENA